MDKCACEREGRGERTGGGVVVDKERRRGEGEEQGAGRGRRTEGGEVTGKNMRRGEGEELREG